MFKKIGQAFLLLLSIIMIISVGNCLIICWNAPQNDTPNNHGINLALFDIAGNYSHNNNHAALDYTDTTSLSVGKGIYFEYAGVIHVHSTYSDGGGTYNMIASIADSLGLDFIIPSDHNTIEPMIDGWNRYVGNILVIPAVEHSTDHGAGHFVSIGDSLTHVRTENVDSDSIYDENINKGNMIFLAHIFHPLHNEWKNWDIGEFTGFEIFNLDENWRENIHPFRVNRIFASAMIYGFNDIALNNALSFPQKQMKKFDELTMTRKVVGIGSTDAHSKSLFSTGMNVCIPNYASMFKLVQTIIITKDPFNGDYKHDRNLVLQALRNGNSYVGFPASHTIKGFMFSAISHSTEVVCGDSLYMGTSAQLKIRLPGTRNTTVQIMKNGEIYKECSNTGEIDLIVSEPGVYRVQAFQDVITLPFLRKRHLPWIISNPIYLSKENKMNMLVSTEQGEHEKIF